MVNMKNIFEFQEPDIIFGVIAGIPMSIPDELKQEDQEIKRPPIVGEWFVVSPTKISRTKMKLLKALGFIVVDMTDWYAAPNGKMASAPKSQIERMVASSISGNYHVNPPNHRTPPGFGSRNP